MRRMFLDGVVADELGDFTRLGEFSVCRVIISD
jgi:hypothetical protein